MYGLSYGSSHVSDSILKIAFSFQQENCYKRHIKFHKGLGIDCDSTSLLHGTIIDITFTVHTDHNMLV